MEKQELTAKVKAYIKGKNLSIYAINQGKQPNPLPLRKCGKRHIVGTKTLVTAHRGGEISDGAAAILEKFFNELEK